MIRGTILLLTLFILSRLYLTHRISSSFFFIGSWFTFSLFATLLSERPYPHYLIQALPSFSLLLAVTLTSKTKEQFFAFPLFVLLGVGLIFYKFYYYPVFPYYQNFLAFSAGKKDKTAYFEHFDKRTPRNYEIADFIVKSSKDKEQVFIWGNDPEIYALTKILPPGRYLTAYHIEDFNGYRQTLKSFESRPPKFIITTMSLDKFPELDKELSSAYIVIEQKGGATIWLLR